MHCRIVREGWKLHYENFAAARHRSGGISHGNVEGLSKSAYFYHLDMLKIRDKCVKPYLKQLRRKAMEDVKDKAWTEEKWIKSQLHLYENNKKLRRQYLWEYKWSLLKDFAVASVYQWDVFASCLWKTALVLAVMIPPVREIGIVAAACAGWPQRTPQSQCCREDAETRIDRLRHERRHTELEPTRTPRYNRIT